MLSQSALLIQISIKILTRNPQDPRCLCNRESTQLPAYLAFAPDLQMVRINGASTPTLSREHTVSDQTYRTLIG